MAAIYTAHATTIAGREGHTKTDDGKLDLDLSPPGGTGKGTNPEQLFAAGYSACFGSAVAAVAKKEGASPSEVKVTADVTLNKSDDGFSLSVVLNVSLPGVEATKAQDIVEKAHQMCPYSKATRGNIEVELKLDDTTIKQAA